MLLRWVPFYTIRHFHQFPFWNPYECGGMPVLGNPQSSVLTPFLLLDLIYGPVVGARLQIIAQIAIGFGGAFFLARVVGISKFGAIVCACAYGGSSWYYLRAEVGHLTFISGTYRAWSIALLYLASERRQLTLAAIGGATDSSGVNGGLGLSNASIGDGPRAGRHDARCSDERRRRLLRWR